MANYIYTNGTNPFTDNKKIITKNIYKIGEIAEGGVVFDTWSGGTEGLIVYPYTLTNSPYIWGCQGLSITGLSSGVYDGKSNSQIIRNSCSDTTSIFNYITGLTLSGYTDWFIPTRDCLYLIFDRIVKQGKYLQPNITNEIPDDGGSHTILYYPDPAASEQYNATYFWKFMWAKIRLYDPITYETISIYYNYSTNHSKTKNSASETCYVFCRYFKITQ